MINLSEYNGELNTLQQQIESDLDGCEDFKARGSLMSLKLKVLQEKAKANALYNETSEVPSPQVLGNLDGESLEGLQEYFANLVR